MADAFFSGALGGRFPTTHRSAVDAVGSDDPAERARSFEILVSAYWRPAYTHVRLRWKKPPEEAQDLTQGFFARAFEKRYFGGYDAEKARFRTYLRTCLDRFVMAEHRDARRKKRGGDAVHLSVDFDRAEADMPSLGAPGRDGPDAYFDREWARGLLGAAVEGLRSSCAARGKSHCFTVFERYVLEDGASEVRPSYAELANELGVSISDVTNYLAAARRDFRRLVLERLREITANDEEFREEARALGVDP